MEVVVEVKVSNKYMRKACKASRSLIYSAGFLPTPIGQEKGWQSHLLANQGGCLVLF